MSQLLGVEGGAGATGDARLFICMIRTAVNRPSITVNRCDILHDRRQPIGAGLGGLKFLAPPVLNQLPRLGLVGGRRNRIGHRRFLFFVYRKHGSRFPAGPQRLTWQGYRHFTIKHGEKKYVRGFIHTNTVEGFWSLVKNGIRGVYHGVSPKYLQTYIDEYAFRYDRRRQAHPMFLSLLGRVHQV